MENIFKKFENLLKNKRALLAVLFFLLSFQMAYSFIFPTHGPGGKAWLSLPDLISHKKSPLDSSEGSIIEKAYGVLGKYYVNADGGQYILLANNFPNHYIGTNPVILDRPLYSFLVAVVAFLPRLIIDSYATIFASAILLNFIFGFLSVVMFYYLCEKMISSRVAALSSFLLIFSPSFHLWLVQPMPEMFTVFMIISSLLLFYNYLKKPSILKFVIFSFIIGILMLGKMLFGISVFIIICALYFRRYKEGIIFLAVHLIPLFLWYLFVIKVLRISFFMNEVADYDVGIWIFKAFVWPWQKTAGIILSALPKFIWIVICGFLLLPIIFSIIGFKKIISKNGRFFVIGFVLSFLILIFAMNLYSPRYGFWIYPVVYPLAVLGIDRVAEFLNKFKNWYSRAFYFAAYISLLLISNCDFYRFVSYG